MTDQPTTDGRSTSPLTMSAGAGIALAGMWIAAAGVTIFLFWGIWIYALGLSNLKSSDLTASNLFLWSLLGLLNAAPMISVTDISRGMMKAR